MARAKRRVHADNDHVGVGVVADVQNGDTRQVNIKSQVPDININGDMRRCVNLTGGDESELLVVNPNGRHD